MGYSRAFGAFGALGAVVLLSWGFPAGAVDPMEGPQYDKMMVIDLEEGHLGMSVGMFAACAQERVMSIVADGVRPMPERRVRGEDIDGMFVVTVPGVNDNILFFFEPMPPSEAGEQLFLARMAIGGIAANRPEDKKGAISALIPNCI